MNFKTDYKLENYILDTSWQDLPRAVQDRLKGCMIDLFGALIVGSKSEQFAAGLKLAKSVFGSGDIAVIGSDERFSFAGAATAMGHSSNAYDIDDGHNITRAHPGTSFVGAILAAAYEKNISRDEFLTALLVAYETTVRMGTALMDYYNYAHSSGTFGAVGVAAGVGKILGFSKEQLNNALSVAEFNAPLVPGIRSVEYPSMNKDGVPFGVMTGVLAVLDTLCGFTGNKHMLEADEYRHYLDDLGQKYQVMDLYFKPYPCCRWAHPAIDACLELINKHGILPNNIKKVTIHTFKRASMLSKIVPKTADEAQYNIAYPVASAIIHGDFGFTQVLEENLNDSTVIDMMSRLEFKVDDKLDARFPAERICRAEIETKNGNCYISSECEPRGEAKENIGIDWLSDKFYRITKPVLSKKGQDKLIRLITQEENLSIREIVDTTNKELG
ncbi:MAG: MmgE/PrpD family protein [Clostridia bacterium]|nr:MmgE/PrpD family protein [Clostridia bacterium]